MPSLTLKNVPEELARRLREEAKRSRRSLNSEILFRLEASFAVPPMRSAEEGIERLERLHRRLSYLPPLTDEEVRRAVEEGRR